jgi:oxygen-dependent protoporphyrinogen oxidase
MTLVEKQHTIGGKIQTVSQGGFLLEAGADGFLSRKPAGVGLCRELGIASALRGQMERRKRSFVMRSHKLYPLPEGFSGLVPANLEALKETQLLSEEGKTRAMSEPAIPARLDDSDESVSTFMTRRFGKEAFERLIEPLCAGIYAGDADALSMTAAFPNLRELELRQGSVLTALRAPPPSSLPSFVTLPGGMAELVHSVFGGLREVRLLTATSADAIRRQGDLWAVEVSNTGDPDKSETIGADAVIVAVPSRAAAGILSGVDPELTETLETIPNASSAVIHLGFRREDVAHDLDGYGYVIPRVEGSDLLACTWTSSKWEERAPAGSVLLRLYARRIASAEALEALAQDELRLTMGIIARPILARVFLWQEAMPQYTLEHSRRLAVIDARCADLRGLYFAGASYRGVGIPECIESGFRAAASAMEYLQ